MVYEGKYYGTLKTEIERIWHEGRIPLVDIDVKGATFIRDRFPELCKTIFIQAPSVEELRRRLELRGTETPETLRERVDKAKHELPFAATFDHIIINDEIERAERELKRLVKDFIGG